MRIGLLENSQTQGESQFLDNNIPYQYLIITHMKKRKALDLIYWCKKKSILFISIIYKCSYMSHTNS